MAKITNFALNFVQEPLQKPFGFKGGHINELWQIVCRIELDNGATGVGIGVQSVLWSDEVTFCKHSQVGGNALMLSVTEYALGRLKGRDFTNPFALQKDILKDVYEYACVVTQNQKLPQTFALNALVSVDFALWQIWAKETKATNFDDICERFCPTLSERQPALGEIPLLTYQTTPDEIRGLLEDGAFILKIKIGSNPDGCNNPQTMCEWDIARIKEIHEIAGGYVTEHTECGAPVYYLDANGRYPSIDLIQRFLDGVKDCGALERIVLLEEPFAEDNLQDVAALPVRVAGDEAAHCAADAALLIDKYHYSAIALKPIAKTLTATLDIYNEAHKRGIPCFCADLTVPPAMLEWNMQLAARLSSIPEVRIGIVESNGSQNYKNWGKLLQMHPMPTAGWICPESHVFTLDSKFYTHNTPFLPMPEYEELLEGGVSTL